MLHSSFYIPTLLIVKVEWTTNSSTFSVRESKTWESVRFQFRGGLKSCSSCLHPVSRPKGHVGSLPTFVILSHVCSSTTLWLATNLGKIRGPTVYDHQDLISKMIGKFLNNRPLNDFFPLLWNTTETSLQTFCTGNFANDPMAYY